MKNVNKVLGVVLALVMVLSVCSTVAFAAVADGKYCAVTVTPTSTNYSKGDKVTFDVNVQTAAGVGAVDRTFQFVLIYDNEVFEPCSDSENLAEHGFVAGSAIGTNIDMANSSLSNAVIGGTTIDPENADGFNDGVLIIIYPNDDSTGMDLTEGGKLFSFDLMLKDDVADGDYKVAYNLADCEMGINYFNPKNGDYAEFFYDGQYYDAPAATVKVGAAATPVIKAAKNGEAVKALVGWGSYDPATDSCDGKFVDDGNGKAEWNLAVEATFSAADLAEAGLTFTKGKCNEIASLEATVKIGDGAATTKSTRFIYGSADGQGNYSYYVVIAGIDNGAADDVTITFGGTLTEAAGGGAITGETVTLNLATEFAAAQVRGLPEAPTAA